MARKEVALVLLALACQENSGPGSADAGVVPHLPDAAGDQPPEVVDAPAVVDGRTGVDTPDAPSVPRIWDADSWRLQILCHSSTSGSFLYQMTRAQLSPQQLTALEGLRAIRPVYMCAGQQGLRCVVDVTAQDGSKLIHEFHTNHSVCRLPPWVIDMATWAPLSQLLPCRNAMTLASSTVPLAPVEGCGHGLLGAFQRDVHLRVPVAGPHHLEIAGCAGFDWTKDVVLELTDELGFEVLARATVPADPGQRAVCRRLNHEFSLPGTYRARIRMPPATAGLTGGLYFRFSPGVAVAEGSCAPTPQPQCRVGTTGGACSDGSVVGECFQSRWVCPLGSLDPRHCSCFGFLPAPTCRCSDRGWDCPDAGAAP